MRGSRWGGGAGRRARGRRRGRCRGSCETCRSVIIDCTLLSIPDGARQGGAEGGSLELFLSPPGRLLVRTGEHLRGRYSPADRRQAAAPALQSSPPAWRGPRCAGGRWDSGGPLAGPCRARTPGGPVAHQSCRACRVYRAADLGALEYVDRRSHLLETHRALQLVPV